MQPFKAVEIIVTDLKLLQKNKSFIIVSIDGRGGAGKTTLALLIKQNLKKVNIITTDDFYNKKLDKIDEQLLEKQILLPLSKGKFGEYLEFDGKSYKKRIIKPKGIIIIEGIFSSHSSISHYFDYIIWIDMSVNMATQRVTLRDNEINPKWEQFYRPYEDEYIRKDNPKSRANVVVDNSLFNIKISDLNKLWKQLL